MNIQKIKEDPHLFFFGDAVNFDIIIRDLIIIHNKTEELDFPEVDNDFSNENEVLITYSFPEVTRNGFIVNLIILYENECKNIFRMLEIIENFPVKWNELRGTNIDKLRIIIFKTVNYDIALSKKEYNNVLSIIELRNCIVHNNATLEDFNKQNSIKELNKEMPDSIINDGRITLSFKSCIQCANIINNFMKTIYNTLLDKY